MKKRLQILIILWSIVLTSYSQNPLIKHYSITSGLPTNTIYYVYQDTENFIWFATDAGAVRFNGNEFRTFNMADGLNDNNVVRIKQDSSGRIWFFNLNGTVNYYYKNIIYNDKNSEIIKGIKSDYHIESFYEDKDSTLYFYNLMYDFFIVKPEQTVKKISRDFYNHENQVLLYLNKSKSGKFLFWTNNNLLELDDLNEEPTLIRKLNKPRRIFPGKMDQSYSYNNNLHEFSLNNDTSVVETYPLDLNSDIVCSIIIDKRGITWISTFDKGVFCLKNKKVFYHLDIEESQAILQDEEENIWITSLKSGVFKINPFFDSVKHFDLTNFENKPIICLGKCNQDGMWCSNGSSVFVVDDKTVVPLPVKFECTDINYLHHLKNNSLIIGKVLIDSYFLNNVFFDPSNNHIWYDKKMIKREGYEKRLAINHSETRITTYFHNKIFFFDPDQNFEKTQVLIGKGRINNVFYNLNDELVINAPKNYVLKNDSVIDNKVLKPLNGQIISSHLILNDSCEILCASGSFLYLQYNNKLYNLEPEYQHTYKIKHLIKQDSHLFFSTIRNVYCINNLVDVLYEKPTQVVNLNIVFNNINDIQCRDSTLYVASDEGLTLVPIQKWWNNQNNVPIPYFNQVKINNSQVDFSSGKVCFKGKKKIDLNFSSINYSSLLVNYLYMMSGLDKNWNRGNDGNVVYQNLGPGTYKFLLKSGTSTNKYSPVKELLIEVQPTFFQKIATWIGIGAFWGLILFYFYVYLKNKKLKQKETAQLLLSLEHKALQSMMNPHFIFNALGSIQNYLIQNRAEEAGLYLSQFARLIRQNLNSLNSNFISIEDESDRLRNYLDLEKIRMGTKLDYTIEINPDIEPEEVLIPSMIIQPFVENSVWHGVSSLETPGKIRIFFTTHTEKSILILIEDNGIGVARAKTFSRGGSHLNIGMELTQKRLQIIGERFKVKTNIQIEELYHGETNPGTKITLTVPFSLDDIQL